MPASLPLFPSEGWSYDPYSSPPPFGHALLKYFPFDEGFVNLNNGSFGTQPLPVFAESIRIQFESEQNPDKYNRIDYLTHMTKARELLADLVGAKVDEIALIPNATHGINSVLRNFEWKEHDVILCMTTTYGALRKTIQYLVDRSEHLGPLVYEIPLVFPMTHMEIINAFRSKIHELKEQHAETKFSDAPWILPECNRTRKNKFVAVIDSIVFNPGVLLPWQDLVRICREEGVWSIVDAAHSLGQETNINLSETQPDFWVANAHKWLFTKRASAAFYVPERNQHIIKTTIPTSHMYKETGGFERINITLPTFVAQHEYTGTQDYSPYFTVQPAIAFRSWLGGEIKINNYCHNLAITGGRRLAEILNTDVLDESGELTLNMTNVRLPLSSGSQLSGGYSREREDEINILLRDKLLYEWHVYVAHFFHGDFWWVRASAQVWNEISDFEYLGEALLQICREIEEKTRKSLDTAI